MLSVGTVKKVIASIASRLVAQTGRPSLGCLGFQGALRIHRNTVRSET